jgi:hypothetical protein
MTLWYAFHKPVPTNAQSFKVLEREKQKNLSKDQWNTSSLYQHAPGWNEYLASESEAHVKGRTFAFRIKPSNVAR